jgi:hypothetical protein
LIWAATQKSTPGRRTRPATLAFAASEQLIVLFSKRVYRHQRGQVKLNTGNLKLNTFCNVGPASRPPASVPARLLFIVIAARKGSITHHASRITHYFPPKTKNTNKPLK